MAAHLTWEEYHSAEVHSVDEMDRIIDQLTIEARARMPFAVVLDLDDEASMGIVLGREESHVEFSSSASRPPVVGCRGPWDDDELIAFSYHGHYSEVPKRYTVPLAEAREALRRFFQTGKRPDNIAWG